MELNLKNKKALITGGSKGIGLGIKKCLEKEGTDCISWSRSEGVDVMKYIPDIPKVNFIIHNIGGGGTWEPEFYSEVMKKNYGTMVNIMLNVDKENLERVIAISSIYGKEAGHNEIFTAAKSAMIGYMKTCARKYGSDKLTYNVICPGHIDVGKDFPDKVISLGQPEDIGNLVTFLCSEKAKHINGAVITCDGGESYSF